MFFFEEYLEENSEIAVEKKKGQNKSDFSKKELIKSNNAISSKSASL